MIIEGKFTKFHEETEKYIIIHATLLTCIPGTSPVTMPARHPTRVNSITASKNSGVPNFSSPGERDAPAA